MKEYKLVYLNKGLRMSREKDLDIAEKELIDGQKKKRSGKKR